VVVAHAVQQVEHRVLPLAALALHADLAAGALGENDVHLGAHAQDVRKKVNVQ